jgi:hypothetical protein
MSIEYNPNNNDNNDEINNINNKISPVVKLFLKRVEQNVLNISIRLFGSVTNFTHFKDKSDVDCCIIYPDEYTRIKLCAFIEDDSIEFNKTRVKIRDIKLSSSGYNDEFFEVYHVCFDDKDRVDINLVNGRIGPIQHRNHNLGMGYKLIIFIIKFLYYEVSVISKELYLYLKGSLFRIRDRNDEAVRSEYRYIIRQGNQLEREPTVLL